MMGLDFLCSAMADAGIPIAAPPIVDGRIHRYKTAGDPEENCWYVFHANGNDFIAGTFGCWKRQIKINWCSRDKSTLTPDEWKETTAAWKQAEAARAEEQRQKEDEARRKCAQMFPGAQPQDHPYLFDKGVKAYGPVTLCTTDLYPDWLALPLQDADGVIHSAQFIADDGAKKFMWGGRVKGCYYPLAERETGPIVICEGYATGASIHEATGWMTLCAMNCGNLQEVATAIHKKYPTRTIVLAADNDSFTEGNPGLTKANAAAKSVAALVAFPTFSDNDFFDKPSDFNDLHRLSGITEVRKQIERAFPVFATAIGTLQYPEENDPAELLKHRYLCRRGGLLLAGPTGVGKSSILVQCFALWANGLPSFGIEPTHPLKCLVIQAENDEGDMAQIRDGVCQGLEFHVEQRSAFFNNVVVHESTGISGKAFCSEVLARLLDLHQPDIVGIDPALAFIGGEIKDQAVVSEFLRGYINPLLRSHNCSALIVSHTNKPPVGKERPNWLNGDMAYIATGNAEWSNWARAILSLQSIGVHGFYKLHAAKRGGRLGWKDPNDTSENSQFVFEKLIRHSREHGVICWHEASESDLPAAALIPESKRKRKNSPEAIATMNLHEFLAACPASGEGLREIGRRLESWLAPQRIDASRATCCRVPPFLVASGMLRKDSDGFYFRGPNA